MTRRRQTLFWTLWSLTAATLAAYAWKLLHILRGLERLRPGVGTERPTVSVIVPARNEESGIRTCVTGILDQDYASDSFEVIVVDDRSDDGTYEIVEQMRAQDSRIRVVRVEDLPDGVAPKKNALQLGIASSTADVVVTTDADCGHPRTWLSGLMRYLEADVGVVVGHTCYREPRTWFEGLQGIDYLSHRIIGAGAVGLGEVISGTGSNLMYRRRVFDEVGGFGESTELVSGDDDLFLHRVRRLSDWKIVVAHTPDTFVVTDPVPTVAGFFRQRARWASKVTGYNVGLKPFLANTGALFALTAVLLPLALVMPRRMAAFLPLFATKLVVDLHVMRKGARVFGQESLLRFFWFSDLLNPYYILVSALWGLFGSFAWKGGSYRRRA